MPLTKIVCTAGPSCDSPLMIKSLYKAGMNVLRINLSHASSEYATKMTKLTRKTAPDLGVLFDTKGPEMRTGTCNEPLVIRKGDLIKIKLTEGICLKNTIYIRGAWKETPFAKGDEILIADGTIELRVISSGKEVTAKASNDGVLTSNKNVSLPSAAKTIERFLSKKDVEDIKLAKELEVDFVAASFISKAADVLNVRKILSGSEIMTFSKIESRTAIKNFPSIANESDGIMVARGDLGLNIPVEEVPLFQKSIISLCNTIAIPVITATQVLDSMTNSPRPTRAEVGDVANAIFDGTDAIMLSGETASGHFPLRTVETLARIASHVEKSIVFNQQSFFKHDVRTIQGFIAKSAYIASFDLNSDAIITHTRTGSTARLISQYRPKVPVFAGTSRKTTYRQLSVSFGVIPFMAPQEKTTDEEMRTSAKTLFKKKLLPKKAKVIMTSGSNTYSTGKTDVLRIGPLDSFMRTRIMRH